MQCLTLDYTRRISAQEFLEHPFLTSDASSQPRLGKIVNDINAFRKNAKFRKAVRRDASRHPSEPCI